MRILLIACLLAAATPAFAQFPPPGIYVCADQTGTTLGTLSLLVAGDYQWDTSDAKSAAGQMASAGTSLEAVSGPLAQQHWQGEFSTEAGKTTFVFDSDAGKVVCVAP